MTPVKAVNHIGIAVHSIDAQRPFDEGTLGAVFEGVEVVPDQKVGVGFFRVGDVRLELLEPTRPARWRRFWRSGVKDSITSPSPSRGSRSASPTWYDPVCA